MEAIRQIVRIPGDHELRIKVPDYLAEDDMVEVILLVKKQQDYRDKIRKMERAASDPLFLEDIRQVEADYEDLSCESPNSLEYLGKRGSKKKFMQALSKIPDVEPEEYDRL